MVLALEVIDSNTIAASTLQAIRDLCSEAYREDFSHALELLGPGVHVIGRLDEEIVSHAMWVDRELEVGGRGRLHTAYVEAVATRPAFQRRGFGTGVMRRLAREIRGYDLGALSPSDEGFYARLGWEAWRGPLFIRTATGIEATPDEGVMILRLERRPPAWTSTRLFPPNGGLVRCGDEIDPLCAAVCNVSRGSGWVPARQRSAATHSHHLDVARWPIRRVRAPGIESGSTRRPPLPRTHR